jgi:hypothetical protein
MIAAPSQYRSLSILLYAISVIEAIAGIVLVFASSWVLSMTTSGLLSSSPGFVLLLMQGIGVIALALAYLMCVAARDPVRYVAVIDSLIFLCFAAAALEIFAVVTRSGGLLYPPWYLLGRAAVQIVVAIVLLALRPKGKVLQAG